MDILSSALALTQREVHSFNTGHSHPSPPPAPGCSESLSIGKIAQFYGSPNESHRLQNEANLSLFVFFILASLGDSPGKETPL